MARFTATFAAPSGLPDAHTSRAGWLIRLSIPLALLARLLIGGSQSIVTDEAVYWSWSRHPAAGYLDHPPLVAWLIWLSCRVFGSTPLGVRFFAPLLGTGAAAIVVWLAGRLLRSTRSAAWCAVLLLGCPLIAILSVIMVPDTPAIFCSAAAMALVIVAVEPDATPSRNRWAWLAAGVMTGFALLAKYTSVLLPLAVVIALLSSPRGRRQFARPWPYLAVLVAVLLFGPVLWWNAKHGWVSFRFQLNHGLGAGIESDSEQVHRGGLLPGLKQVAEFVAGQLAVWNPVLMGLGLLAVISCLRRYRELEVSRHILIWCALTPLLFFGAATFKARGEINWPGFAYLPMTILILEFAARADSSRVWGMLRLGTGIALFCGIAMAFPWQLAQAGVRFSKFDELFGWDRFAARLDDLRAGAPVVVNSQRDAGQIAFNLPGKPQVWVSGVGSRPTAFDYMNTQPDYSTMPTVAFVGGHADRFCQKYGFVVLRYDKIRVKLETGKERLRPVTILVLPPAPSTRPAAPTEGAP